jgi:hypothetical protein
MPRVAFFLIAVFWAVMNVLLWRAEYGPRGGGVPVPADLVWRKILTAPDISSLTIYQDGRRIGFCEFSTSVEQAMAQTDEGQLPPEGYTTRSGSQIRFSGNFFVGDITNQFRFDTRIEFSPNRDWRELALKFSSYLGVVKIQSVATNQTLSVSITNNDSSFSRVFSFADLQKPDVLLHAIAGDFTNPPTSGFILPSLPTTSWLAGGIRWEATRDRLLMGREPVSAFRLQTRVFNLPMVIYASALGDILRVELPSGITASIDQWNHT